MGTAAVIFPRLCVLRLREEEQEALLERILWIAIDRRHLDVVGPRRQLRGTRDRTIDRIGVMIRGHQCDKTKEDMGGIGIAMIEIGWSQEANSSAGQLRNHDDNLHRRGSVV